MCALDVKTLQLGLPSTVISPGRPISNPKDLNDDSVIKTYDDLRATFIVLKSKLVNLGFGIANDLVIPTCNRKQSSEGIVIKQYQPGKTQFDPGNAAIFELSLEDSGINLQYGLGICDPGKENCPRSLKDPINLSADSITVGELKEKFQEFLNLVLPTVLKWDEEYAQHELKQKLNFGHTVDQWIVSRVLRNLTNDEGLTLDGKPTTLNDLTNLSGFINLKSSSSSDEVYFVRKK